jgi:TonB family protein
VETVQTPQPAAPPKAPAAQPQQLTVNGPPQAGGDAFGLAAGKGGGQAVVGGDGPGGAGGGGGAFAESAYYRYAAALMQQAVQNDDRVTRSAFTLDLRLWIDGEGKVTNAAIAKSSGDNTLDRQVVVVVEGMKRFDQPPPASMKFPLRVTIRGRRA